MRGVEFRILGPLEVRGGETSLSLPGAGLRASDDPMSLTPAQLAAGALDSSYALPTVQQGPTTAVILASMSPQTRRYTAVFVGPEPTVSASTAPITAAVSTATARYSHLRRCRVGTAIVV